MYSNMTGEVARVRQSELLATAQHQRLVRAARAGRSDRPARPDRIRHRLATVLVATADRLEPMRLRQAAAAPSAEPC